MLDKKIKDTLKKSVTKLSVESHNIYRKVVPVEKTAEEKRELELNKLLNKAVDLEREAEYAEQAATLKERIQAAQERIEKVQPKTHYGFKFKLPGNPVFKIFGFLVLLMVVLAIIGRC